MDSGQPMAIGDALVARCLSRGADRAEALIKTGATRSVVLGAGGDVNWTRTAEGGIALRAFLPGGLVGFAALCGPAPPEPDLLALVDAAIGAASPCGVSIELPAAAAGDGRGLGIFDTRLHAATPADLEGILDQAATEALRSDPRVRRLATASIAASSSFVHLVNSAGFHGGYHQTLFHLSLGLVAGDAGASVVVRRSRTARTLAAFSPALFGDQTARLAAAEVTGRRSPDGSVPALLAPAASVEALRLFARALGAGRLRGGATVGSRLLTIIDDGRLPGGVASAPFDGEGVATRRTTVVSRGIFQEPLHDLASAAHSGACSTGNGLRASFRDPPRRLPSNLFIAPGGDEPEGLLSGLADLGDGIWIQSLRPAPALAAEEGTLAAVAAGEWLESGRPGTPVAGVLVTCRLAELLEGVAGVGNDLTFGFPGGSFGAPSLLVRQVSLRMP